MPGVIVGEDAVPDAFHTVTDDEHGGGHKQRGDPEGQELGPERLGEFTDQQQRGNLHHKRAADQSQDQAGVHLAQDIIVCFVTEIIQHTAEQRQRAADQAGGQVHSGTLGISCVGHDYMLLSLRFLTTNKQVNAAKPTALAMTAASNAVFHQTCPRPAEASASMPLSSALLT